MLTRVLTPVFFALIVAVGAALAGPTNGAEPPAEAETAQLQSFNRQVAEPTPLEASEGPSPTGLGPSSMAGGEAWDAAATAAAPVASIPQVAEAHPGAAAEASPQAAVDGATAQASLCLYGAPHCEPCQLAKAALQGLAQRHSIAWRYVDLASDPKARKAYGQRIPVLVLGDRVVGEGRLDQAALRVLLMREGLLGSWPPR